MWLCLQGTPGYFIDYSCVLTQAGDLSKTDDLVGVKGACMYPLNILCGKHCGRVLSRKPGWGATALREHIVTSLTFVKDYTRSMEKLAIL